MQGSRLQIVTNTEAVSMQGTPELEVRRTRVRIEQAVASAYFLRIRKQLADRVLADLGAGQMPAEA